MSIIVEHGFHGRIGSALKLIIKACLGVFGPALFAVKRHQMNNALHLRAKFAKRFRRPFPEVFLPAFGLARSASTFRVIIRAARS
jgi:hypothetical protein